jgi:hypothetical protein
MVVDFRSMPGGLSAHRSQGLSGFLNQSVRVNRAGSAIFLSNWQGQAPEIFTTNGYTTGAPLKCVSTDRLREGLWGRLVAGGTPDGDVQANWDASQTGRS